MFPVSFMLSSMLSAVINNFAEVIIPKKYLLTSAFLFVLATIGLLVFIIIYLIQFLKSLARRKYLTRVYSDVICEFVICETEVELQQTLQQPHILAVLQKGLAKPFGRNFFVKELVVIHKSMSGRAAENVRWIYNYFALANDSLQRLNSSNWNVKALGIQELAEMQQHAYVQLIFNETNNRNHYVRTEAQVAMVKLTGFKGLHFLHNVSYPITQWQQVSLIHQLALQHNDDWSSLYSWLTSANTSVVEFALRLIEAYRLFELHNAVINCLQHSSVHIQRQAINVLKEIGGEETVPVLIQQFYAGHKEKQLIILNALIQLGLEKEEGFLTSLLNHTDAAISTLAQSILKNMQAANAVLPIPTMVLPLMPGVQPVKREEAA